MFSTKFRPLIAGLLSVFILAGQLHASVAGGCGCISSQAPVETGVQEVQHSCCGSPSKRKPERENTADKCCCGDRCGVERTACVCGCSDSEPLNDQEQIPDATRVVVEQLDSVSIQPPIQLASLVLYENLTATSSPRGQEHVLVQILFCVWQT